MRVLSISSVALVLAVVVAGCAPKSAPPPTATIDVTGPTGPLATGEQRAFTATVAGSTDIAVSWSVVEAGGGTIDAGGTYTAPSTPATWTVRATLVSDPRVHGDAPVPVVIPIGSVPGYDVGVDYHSTGTDFLHTTFVSTYDHADVRSAVKAQLQGMADRGATFVFTRLWFVTDPGTSDGGETWRLHFPMSAQEAANLRAYAQDVASIVGTGGNRLRLETCLLWLGAADYMQGDPVNGLGTSSISGADYTTRALATIDSVVGALSGVSRPDGVDVADAVYLDGEVMIGAKPNEDWMLEQLYEPFRTKVAAAGLTPTIYFIAVPNQVDVLDDGYVDVDYPALDGHKSMYWIYRSVKFMADQGMAMPARMDFSCYVGVTTSSDGTVLHRILDDADATLPSLGMPAEYGAAETYYHADPAARRSLGQAFAAEAASSSRLKRVSFWTTPDSDGPGVDAAYPFTIEDFQPPPAP